MAASTANMVQSKAGKLYEASSPQGKMIVTAATTGKDADFNSSTDSSTDSSKMDMLQTLQAIYEETQESSDTLDEIEVHLDDDDNPLDDARDNLKASNKDKKKFRLAEGLKKAAGGVQAGFGKVKESLSGKLGLALLGGGLLLLNKYGDEIAGPDGWLTKFLKYMKEDLIPDVKALYEDLQVWWDVGWKKVTGFFTFLETTFTSIGAYIDSFDTDGVKGLSDIERDELMADLQEKGGKFVGDMLMGMLSGLGSALFSGALAFSGISLAKSALLTSGLFAKTGTIPAAAATGGAVTGLKAMKVGAGGYIAIGLMVAGGIAAMYDAAGRAATAALDEEEVTGKPASWTTWASSFISGGDKGTWANAFANLQEKGMMGASVGVALGVPFGPAGMLLGGMIGALAGGLFGLVTGKIGAEKMKKTLDGLDGAIDKTGTAISEHFNGIIDAFKALVPGGESPAEAYRRNLGRDNTANLRTRKELEAEIEATELARDQGIYRFNKFQTIDEVTDGEMGRESTQMYLRSLREKIAKLDTKIAMNPVYDAEEKVEAAEEQVVAAEFELEMSTFAQSGLENVRKMALKNPKAAIRMLYQKYQFDMREKGLNPKSRDTWLKESGGLEGALKNEQMIVDQNLVDAKTSLVSSNTSLSSAKEDYQAMLGSTPGAFELQKSRFSKFQGIASSDVINQLKLERAMSNYGARRTPEGAQTIITTSTSSSSSAPVIVPTGLGARNDFWANYDTLEAATN